MDIKRFLVLGGLVLGVSAANTAAAEGDSDLKERLDRAETRLAEIEHKQSETWLSERRVEEVKTLVHEVLADADTRASLVEGSTAGHNGENFFLSSEDGSFVLNIGGQIQVRHIFNNTDTAGDNDERGFNIARLQLAFSGQISDPRLKYSIVVEARPDDSEMNAKEAVISYGLTDNVTLWAGETKAPFLREELISSSRQLAVERSVVNEVFTMGYVQGIGVDWSVSDMLRVSSSINDGVRSGENDNNNDADLHIGNGQNNLEWDADQSDFAMTTRADVRLMGTWEQGDDFTAGTGEETSVLLGAAVHYEAAETGGGNNHDSFVTWTVDGSAECSGWSVYLATVGLHIDLDNDAAGEDLNLYGALAQVGYQLVPDKLEPFVRWEYIDLSDIPANGADQELQFVTAGFNWYLSGHAAKITTDVVWAVHSVPGAFPLGVDGDTLDLLGIRGDDSSDIEDQLSLRVQFQMLF